MRRRLWKRVLSTFAISALVLAIAGCSSVRSASAVTLYERLGGETAVEALVSRMLARIAQDERIAPTFAATNISRLHELLEEQICEIADGPCVYTGFTMRESHRGMSVTDAEFNAVVESLMLAMNDLDIDMGVQNELLARLAPLRADITYR